ncbi:MAG TPA: histidine kinase [Nocardioides sp.]|nr:histidine kinase [Nocardioides sp.]
MPWQLLRRHADPALGVGVLALYAWEVSRWSTTRPGLLLAVAAVGTIGLALRRRTPLVAFLVCGASIEGITAVAPGFDNDSAALVITFGVSLYSLGRYAVGLEQWLGVAALVAVMVSFVLSEADPAVDSGDVGFVLLFAGTPWAAGVVVRLRLERERLLRERNAALQRDQEARARAAVATERARIARELHDVVAHAISVTVMQARGGRAMLGRDEAEVRRALDAIEQTNTAALSDMRRLLAVLRDTEDQPDGRAAPQPSLANLDSLVEQVRAAGLPVELAVTGSQHVPPGVDLSAYRIVQEALTNVLKHAGPTATARVEVDYGADSLRVTVLDDGVGPLGPAGARSTDGSGHGLTGIRERVAVIGGRVEAGPGTGGEGFVVTAVLPYALEVSPAPEVTA